MKAYHVYDTRNELLGTYMSAERAEKARVEANEGEVWFKNGALVVECDVADHDPKEAALALHLDCSLESVSECRYGDNQYESTDEPGEYLVVTDSEADEAHLELCKQYADENLVPENASPYLTFDYEGFARDNSDRGETLGRYDSEENAVDIDGTAYYIYRVQ